jgi:cytochrome c peroxidase
VVFEVQGCQNCHGGKNWTISALDYTPPPIASDVNDAQLQRFLCKVGTFDPTLFTDGVSNEIRANTAVNTQARGGLGFNVPSLISVFASAPYLHSGAAAGLDDVLRSVTHRTAGRADHLDFLTVPIFRRFLVQFLKSIDRDTTPFLNVVPPADVCGP